MKSDRLFKIGDIVYATLPEGWKFSPFQEFIVADYHAFTNLETNEYLLRPIDGPENHLYVAGETDIKRVQ
jgi:hypothetical protein